MVSKRKQNQTKIKSNTTDPQYLTIHITPTCHPQSIVLITCGKIHIPHRIPIGPRNRNSPNRCLTRRRTHKLMRQMMDVTRRSRNRNGRVHLLLSIYMCIRKAGSWRCKRSRRSETRRHRRRRRSRPSALVCLGGSILDTDGRRLELEGWLGSCWGARGCVLDCTVVVGAGPDAVFAVFCGRVGVLRLGRDPWGFGGLGEAIRCAGTETWGVRGGLEALCEVELGAGFFATVHGLGKSSLCDEAVEDDGVDEDDEDFNDDFDDGTDETPVLETAEESVVDFFVEELLSQVLVAGPSPHVLAITVGFGGLVDGCGDDPHDHAEEEEADGE